MTRFAAATFVSLLMAVPAAADIERIRAEGTVDEVMARLSEAVEAAGATIFATVDHAQGAANTGMQLSDSRLLIFGNPEIGTPVMQQDMLAGLSLPLDMLVYSDDDGQTWVAYENVDGMFDGLDVDDDLPALDRMRSALESLASAAAG